MSRFRYRYVRQIKGGRWEGRVWLNDHDGYLSLGSRPSPLEAWAVVRRYLNEGILPEGLLPKWVRERKVRDADTGKVVAVVYYARVLRGGHKFRTEEFDTPEDAQEAMRVLLRRAFGRNWMFWSVRKGRIDLKAGR